MKRPAAIVALWCFFFYGPGRRGSKKVSPKLVKKIQPSVVTVIPTTPGVS